MSEQKEKILTPEEYYQNAYNRIISIGEAIKKGLPRESYELSGRYRFSFDATVLYHYIGINGDKRHMFEREGDKARMVLGKYNTLDPEKQ